MARGSKCACGCGQQRTGGWAHIDAGSVRDVNGNTVGEWEAVGVWERRS